MAHQAAKSSNILYPQKISSVVDNSKKMRNLSQNIRNDRRSDSANRLKRSGTERDAFSLKKFDTFISSERRDKLMRVNNVNNVKIVVDNEAEVDEDDSMGSEFGSAHESGTLKNLEALAPQLPEIRRRNLNRPHSAILRESKSGAKEFKEDGKGNNKKLLDDEFLFDAKEAEKHGLHILDDDGGEKLKFAQLGLGLINYSFKCV